MLALIALVAAGCGIGNEPDDSGCDGTCAQQALSADDVRTVIRQGVAEASLLDVDVTIAVVDRVGNVLGVFRMDGAAGETTITSQRNVSGGLEGIAVPAAFAAISKAGTAAYLSSQGSGFSTRTASQIIQEHFIPGERGRPGGPLFGVQFSSLPCSDIVNSSGTPGPHPLPLGLAADPGGLPLFKDSGDARFRVPVGGVGVEGVLENDGSGQPRALYRLANSADDFEERIAAAATRGFETPHNRRAERITVDGRALWFSDSGTPQFQTAAAFDSLPGELIAAAPFAEAEVRAGVALGTLESGIVATTFAGSAAEILPRFPVKASLLADGLDADEITAILAKTLALTFRTRAQIRRPLGTPARVSIAIVDADGAVLGLVRAPDAPLFGIDVAVQKARSASFFSAANAGRDLSDAGFGSYVAATRNLLGDTGAFNGRIAYSDAAIGNLSRPFFPDGIDGNAHGPLSRAFPDWSPFANGLQLDLVFEALAAALFEAEVRPCTPIAALANGIQIFPGSVPIYRGAQLVGGIGISGDGIDQDNLFAFLGLHLASVERGTFANAPPQIRADTLSVNGSHLRYVSCPVAPFLDSNEQGACDGL